MTPTPFPKTYTGAGRTSHRQPLLRFACVEGGRFPSLSVTHTDGSIPLGTTGGTWDRGDAVGRQRLIDRMTDFLRGRGVPEAREKVMGFIAERERVSGCPLL